MQRRGSGTGVLNAYAALTKGLVWRDPFGVGAPVLTWIDNGAGYWTQGTILREVAGNRYDVRCDEGDQFAQRHSLVLSPSSGGAGAVLREAAAMGATDLVEALLRKGTRQGRTRTRTMGPHRHRTPWPVPTIATVLSAQCPLTDARAPRAPLRHLDLRVRRGGADRAAPGRREWPRERLPHPCQERRRRPRQGKYTPTPRALPNVPCPGPPNTPCSTAS